MSLTKSPTRIWFRAVALLVAVILPLTEITPYAEGYSGAQSGTPLPNHLDTTAREIRLLPFDIDKLAIPEALGTVTGRFKGKPNGLIVQLQDAHGNLSAQDHLAGIVNFLHENYKADALLLEGGEGELSMREARAFPNREIRRRVSRKFLEQFELTGPEYYVISENPQMNVFGLEKMRSYYANRELYLEARKRSKDLESVLARFELAVKNIAGEIWNKNLQEFVRSSERVSKNHELLLEHLKKSKAIYAGRKGILDFERHFPKLAQILSEAGGDPLSLEAFGDEYENLMSAVRNLLIRNETERAADRSCVLTQRFGKLLRLELTPDEFKSIEVNIAQLSQVSFRGIFEQLGKSNRWRAEYDRLFESMACFVKFYEGAHIRDIEMAERSRKYLRKSKQKLVIAVTGGFHTPGFSQALEEAQCSYLVIRPRMEQVEKAEKEKLRYHKHAQLDLARSLSVSQIVELEPIAGFGSGERYQKLLGAMRAEAAALKMKTADTQDLMKVPSALPTTRAPALTQLGESGFGAEADKKTDRTVRDDEPTSKAKRSSRFNFSFYWALSASALSIMIVIAGALGFDVERLPDMIPGYTVAKRKIAEWFYADPLTFIEISLFGAAMAAFLVFMYKIWPLSPGTKRHIEKMIRGRFKNEEERAELRVALSDFESQLEAIGTNAYFTYLYIMPALVKHAPDAKNLEGYISAMVVQPDTEIFWRIDDAFSGLYIFGPNGERQLNVGVSPGTAYVVSKSLGALVKTLRSPSEIMSALETMEVFFTQLENLMEERPPEKRFIASASFNWGDLLRRAHQMKLESGRFSVRLVSDSEISVEQPPTAFTENTGVGTGFGASDNEPAQSPRQGFGSAVADRRVASAGFGKAQEYVGSETGRWLYRQAATPVEYRSESGGHESAINRGWAWVRSHYGPSIDRAVDELPKDRKTKILMVGVGRGKAVLELSRRLEGMNVEIHSINREKNLIYDLPHIFEFLDSRILPTRRDWMPGPSDPRGAEAQRLFDLHHANHHVMDLSNGESFKDLPGDFDLIIVEPWVLMYIPDHLKVNERVFGRLREGGKLFSEIRGLRVKENNQSWLTGETATVVSWLKKGLGKDNIEELGETDPHGWANPGGSSVLVRKAPGGIWNLPLRHLVFAHDDTRIGGIDFYTPTAAGFGAGDNEPAQSSERPSTRAASLGAEGGAKRNSAGKVSNTYGARRMWPDFSAMIRPLNSPGSRARRSLPMASMILSAYGGWIWNMRMLYWLGGYIEMFVKSLSSVIRILSSALARVAFSKSAVDDFTRTQSWPRLLSTFASFKGTSSSIRNFIRRISLIFRKESILGSLRTQPRSGARLLRVPGSNQDSNFAQRFPQVSRFPQEVRGQRRRGFVSRGNRVSHAGFVGLPIDIFEAIHPFLYSPEGKTSTGQNVRQVAPSAGFGASGFAANVVELSKFAIGNLILAVYALIILWIPYMILKDRIHSRILRKPIATLRNTRADRGERLEAIERLSPARRPSPPYWTRKVVDEMLDDHDSAIRKAAREIMYQDFRKHPTIIYGEEANLSSRIEKTAKKYGDDLTEYWRLYVESASNDSSRFVKKRRRSYFYRKAIEELSDASKPSSDRQAAVKAAARMLSLLPEEGWEEKLSKMIKYDDVIVRRVAIKAMRDLMRRRKAIPLELFSVDFDHVFESENSIDAGALVPALSDPDTEVRRTATLALAGAFMVDYTYNLDTDKMLAEIERGVTAGEDIEEYIEPFEDALLHWIIEVPFKKATAEHNHRYYSKSWRLKVLLAGIERIRARTELAQPEAAGNIVDMLAAAPPVDGFHWQVVQPEGADAVVGKIFAPVHEKLDRNRKAASLLGLWPQFEEAFKRSLEAAYRRPVSKADVARYLSDLKTFSQKMRDPKFASRLGEFLSRYGKSDTGGGAAPPFVLNSPFQVEELYRIILALTRLRRYDAAAAFETKEKDKVIRAIAKRRDEAADHLKQLFGGGYADSIPLSRDPRSAEEVFGKFYHGAMHFELVADEETHGWIGEERSIRRLVQALVSDFKSGIRPKGLPLTFNVEFEKPLQLYRKIYLNGLKKSWIKQAIPLLIFLGFVWLSVSLLTDKRTWLQWMGGAMFLFTTGMFVLHLMVRVCIIGEKYSWLFRCARDWVVGKWTRELSGQKLLDAFIEKNLAREPAPAAASSASAGFGASGNEPAQSSEWSAEGGVGKAQLSLEQIRREYFLVWEELNTGKSDPKLTNPLITKVSRLKRERSRKGERKPSRRVNIEREDNKISIWNDEGLKITTNTGSTFYDMEPGRRIYVEGPTDSEAISTGYDRLCHSCVEIGFIGHRGKKKIVGAIHANRDIEGVAQYFQRLKRNRNIYIDGVVLGYRSWSEEEVRALQQKLSQKGIPSVKIIKPRAPNKAGLLMATSRGVIHVTMRGRDKPGEILDGADDPIYMPWFSFFAADFLEWKEGSVKIKLWNELFPTVGTGFGAAPRKGSAKSPMAQGVPAHDERGRNIPSAGFGATGIISTERKISEEGASYAGAGSTNRGDPYRRTKLQEALEVHKAELPLYPSVQPPFLTIAPHENGHQNHQNDTPDNKQLQTETRSAQHIAGDHRSDVDGDHIHEDLADVFLLLGGKHKVDHIAKSSGELLISQEQYDNLTFPETRAGFGATTSYAEIHAQDVHFGEAIEPIIKQKKTGRRRVYYPGIGPALPSFGGSPYKIDFLMPFIATEYTELIAVEIRGITFDEFQNLVRSELAAGGIDGEIDFSHERKAIHIKGPPYVRFPISYIAKFVLAGEERTLRYYVGEDVKEFVMDMMDMEGIDVVYMRNENLSFYRSFPYRRIGEWRKALKQSGGGFIVLDERSYGHHGLMGKAFRLPFWYLKFGAKRIPVSAASGQGLYWLEGKKHLSAGFGADLDRSDREREGEKGPAFRDIEPALTGFLADLFKNENLDGYLAAFELLHQELGKRPEFSDLKKALRYLFGKYKSFSPDTSLERKVSFSLALIHYLQRMLPLLAGFRWNRKNLMNPDKFSLAELQELIRRGEALGFKADPGWESLQDRESLVDILEKQTLRFRENATGILVKIKALKQKPEHAYWFDYDEQTIGALAGSGREETIHFTGFHIFGPAVDGTWFAKLRAWIEKKLERIKKFSAIDRAVVLFYRRRAQIQRDYPDMVERINAFDSLDAFDQRAAELLADLGQEGAPLLSELARRYETLPDNAATEVERLAILGKLFDYFKPYGIVETTKLRNGFPIHTDIMDYSSFLAHINPAQIENFRSAVELAYLTTKFFEFYSKGNSGFGVASRGKQNAEPFLRWNRESSADDVKISGRDKSIGDYASDNSQSRKLRLPSYILARWSIVLWQTRDHLSFLVGQINHPSINVISPQIKALARSYSLPGPRSAGFGMNAKQPIARENPEGKEFQQNGIFAEIGLDILELIPRWVFPLRYLMALALGKAIRKEISMYSRLLTIKASQGWLYPTDVRLRHLKEIAKLLELGRGADYETWKAIAENLRHENKDVRHAALSILTEEIVKRRSGLTADGAIHTELIKLEVHTALADMGGDIPAGGDVAPKKKTDDENIRFYFRAFVRPIADGKVRFWPGRKPDSGRSRNLSITEAMSIEELLSSNDPADYQMAKRALVRIFKMGHHDYYTPKLLVDALQSKQDSELRYEAAYYAAHTPGAFKLTALGLADGGRDYKVIQEEVFKLLLDYDEQIREGIVDAIAYQLSEGFITSPFPLDPNEEILTEQLLGSLRAAFEKKKLDPDRVYAKFFKAFENWLNAPMEKIEEDWQWQPGATSRRFLLSRLLAEVSRYRQTGQPPRLLNDEQWRKVEHLWEWGVLLDPKVSPPLEPGAAALIKTWITLKVVKGEELTIEDVREKLEQVQKEESAHSLKHYYAGAIDSDYGGLIERSQKMGIEIHTNTRFYKGQSKESRKRALDILNLLLFLVDVPKNRVLPIVGNAPMLIVPSFEVANPKTGIGSLLEIQTLPAFAPSTHDETLRNVREIVSVLTNGYDVFIGENEKETDAHLEQHISVSGREPMKHQIESVELGVASFNLVQDEPAAGQGPKIRELLISEGPQFRHRKSTRTGDQRSEYADVGKYHVARDRGKQREYDQANLREYRIVKALGALFRAHNPETGTEIEENGKGIGETLRRAAGAYTLGLEQLGLLDEQAAAFPDLKDVKGLEQINELLKEAMDEGPQSIKAQKLGDIQKIVSQAVNAYESIAYQSGISSGFGSGHNNGSKALFVRGRKGLDEILEAAPRRAFRFAFPKDLKVVLLEDDTDDDNLTHAKQTAAALGRALHLKREQVWMGSALDKQAEDWLLNRQIVYVGEAPLGARFRANVVEENEGWLAFFDMLRRSRKILAVAA